MFTGIVEAVGTITSVERLGAQDGSGSGGRRLTLEAPFAGELEVGGSVSLSGACQTVVSVDAAAGTFAVDTIEETLRKTTFGALRPGDPVNLERPLEAGGRLDGHFVQGHVDAVGTIRSAEKEETNWIVEIGFDQRFAPYLIPVGSIAVDGISLTVARLQKEEGLLTVAIIPYTYQETTAQHWTEGRAVNLEFDMLGKYVVGWLDHS